jgi:hypothetical protein
MINHLSNFIFPNYEPLILNICCVSRLPNSDPLRPRVGQLADLAMHVLANDNEENAVVALRVIIELHKAYVPHLEDKVQVCAKK